MKGKVGGMEERQIRIFVRKGRKRLLIYSLRKWTLCGLAAGVTGACAAAVLALFVPLYSERLIELVLFGFCVLAGAVTGILMAPDEKRTAEILDDCGLSEHLITSYERFGKDDLFSSVQREETAEAVMDFPLREKLKRKLPAKQLGYIAAMLVFFLVVCVTPAKSKQLAAERQELEKVLGEQIEKIEARKEELFQKLELSEVSEETKTAVEEMIQTATEEWKQAKDQKELEKSKERLEKKLEQELEQHYQKNTMTALQKLEDLQSQAALAAGDSGREQTEKLLQKLQEAAEQVSKLAEEEALSGLTETQMKELSASAGDLAALLETGTGNLSEAVTEAAALSQQLKQGGVSSASGSSVADADLETTQLSSAQEGGEGKQGGGSDGESDGGNSPASKKDEDNKNKNGSGSDNEGQKSGSGWDNRGGSGIEREMLPAAKEETVMLQAAPESASGLSGKADGSSDSLHTKVKGEGSTGGEEAEYRSVVQEYSERALMRVEKGEIPKDMEGVVKSYFEGLNNN